METRTLKKLRIELLSDLCTSVGETYNSLVDMDSAYDDYGFPYIPAKRIKGCIREAALELLEFGAFDEKVYKKLFGENGENASNFTLSNAYLENYEEMLSDVKSEKNKSLVHPQNVLGLYTYMRTQTALDMETGAADRTSLRTMRVVKRGLIFEAGLHFSEDIKAEEERKFWKAVGMVKHMGLHRTRGLGFVKLTEEKKEKNAVPSISVPDERQIQEKVNEKDRVKLSYKVTLKSPMLCKSAEGNQGKTQDYIEGAKVLGMIAGAMGKETFQEMMREQKKSKEKELIISNAYIVHKGKRCTPLRASLQKKKDLGFDENHQMEVYDMLSGCNPDEQLTPIHDPYATEKGSIKRVETEIHYHHRRPKDKSIGRATGRGDSAFYQLDSIRAGQSFEGFMLAAREHAVKICEALGKLTNVRMGYARNTEYGDVKIKVEAVDFDGYDADPAPKLINRFILTLNAPIILYNENGMLSADINVLKEYLEKELETELEIENPFLNYETIGGFNVTWKRRKPIFTSLGKGSTCVIYARDGIREEKLHDLFIGERISEGYGEIQIVPVFSGGLPEVVTLRKEEEKAKPEERKTNIIDDLSKAQTNKNLESEARRQAENLYEKLKTDSKKKSGLNAVIAKLILICRTETSYKEAEMQVKGIENDSKRALALEIFEKMKPDTYGKPEQFPIFAEAYLKEIKYRMRTKEEEEEQKCAKKGKL